MNPEVGAEVCATEAARRLETVVFVWTSFSGTCWDKYHRQNEGNSLKCTVKTLKPQYVHVVGQLITHSRPSLWCESRRNVHS